ncbi:MAG TPA: CehA/McbA family metallohydrolase, partial [Polyangiaceae bacterium]|nr:CehA/McbA family metallohydrolase [Polyangiaceae bacterium]
RVLVSDERGAPLPARILVRGVPPTADPNFGDEQVAKGYANVAYTLAGDARLTIPAGSYRVTVTHGPERELATQQVDIGAARGGTMRARLARALEPQGWLACDFHVHAAPSFDSRVPLMDRVTALVAEGIDFAVATDHNHVTDYAPTIAELSAPLGTATGVEITTRAWGHFNAFPFPASQAPPPFADIDPPALFAHVRQHAPGAIIQVNHARMGDIGYFNRGRLDPRTGESDPAFSFDFDTLEVFNGFDLNGVDRVEEYVREWLTLMAFGRRYTAVGSSDSHKIAYQWAGYPRTYVRVPPDVARDQAMSAIIEGLRRGRAMVTNGPFLDVEAEDKGLGSIVKARDGRVRLRVEVLGPQWIEVDNLRYATLDGPIRLAAEPGEGAVRLRFEGEIEVRRDTFLVVAVRGSKRMEEVLAGASALPFAFTNPIWIDADADGALNLTK